MDYFNRIAELAVSNKCTRWYLQICQNAAHRSSSRKEAKAKLGYVEAHHILPKSFGLGGVRDSANLVYLNAKEHFICHHLLTKMFTRPDHKTKMGYALWLMLNTRGLQISARRYAQFKEQVPVVVSEETRTKIRVARAKQVICHSEETKIKMSTSNKGKLRSQDARKNMHKPRPSICGENNPRYGKPHSEEAKRKMSLGKSGKRWMTHPVTKKIMYVTPDAVPHYLKEGWVTGQRLRPRAGIGG